jgi:tRNA nucleotidyltransferase (CCA-adding enzyme)
MSPRSPVPGPLIGDARLQRIAEAFAAAGGRALVVGGAVRDAVLGLESPDWDLEIHGLRLPEVEAVLAGFGEVIAIGRSFGVLKIKGLEADFALPRRDSKAGRGHRGFVVDLDPDLGFPEAARRRDVTVNAMGFDPLTGEILDPWGGLDDLAARRLRAVDVELFGDDPLRALRVAQFAARFELEPDAELLALCAAMPLEELPGERIAGELEKLLLKARRPSIGLELMRRTGMLRIFPELGGMVGVAQDPEWHPEGTVWEHTLLVVDEAAALRRGDGEDLSLMWGALLHDVGKPPTTYTDAAGRVRSPGHEEVGVPLAEAVLSRLRLGHEVIGQVAALVRFHLAPAQLDRDGVTPKAVRRLVRRLTEAGIRPELLLRVAEADHFGRTTPDALAREFPAGERLAARIEEIGAEAAVAQDVVLGRHLIARGMQPGPEFGPILERCREVQDETGWSDPEAILERVLGKGLRD